MHRPNLLFSISRSHPSRGRIAVRQFRVAVRIGLSRESYRNSGFGIRSAYLFDSSDRSRIQDAEARILHCLSLSDRLLPRNTKNPGFSFFTMSIVFCSQCAHCQFGCIHRNDREDKIPEIVDSSFRAHFWPYIHW
jgi:hypothetical protein